MGNVITLSEEFKQSLLDFLKDCEEFYPGIRNISQRWMAEEDYSNLLAFLNVIPNEESLGHTCRSFAKLSLDEVKALHEECIHKAPLLDRKEALYKQLSEIVRK